MKGNEAPGISPNELRDVIRLRGGEARIRRLHTGLCILLVRLAERSWTALFHGAAERSNPDERSKTVLFFRSYSNADLEASAAPTLAAVWNAAAVFGKAHASGREIVLDHAFRISMEGIERIDDELIGWVETMKRMEIFLTDAARGEISIPAEKHREILDEATMASFPVIETDEVRALLAPPADPFARDDSKSRRPDDEPRSIGVRRRDLSGLSLDD
jgi:hypothetical protein